MMGLRFDPTISFSDSAVFIAIIIFGWGIIRHMLRMEFKVDIMWEVFKGKILSSGEIEEMERRHKKRI
jgi:hypothetical protein